MWQDIESMLCESNLHQVDANLASSCKVAIEFQDAPSGQSDTMLMNLGSAIGSAYAANSSVNQTNSNHPVSQALLQYGVSCADYAESSSNSFNSSQTNLSQNNQSSPAGPSNARISQVQINSQVNAAYPQDQLNTNYFDLNFMLPDAPYALSNGGLHPQVNGIHTDQPEAHQPDHHLRQALPPNQQVNSNLTAAYVQYSGDRSERLDSSGVYPADSKSQLSAVLNSATQLRTAFHSNGQPASSQMSPPASPERLQQLQQLQRQQQLQLHQSNHFTNIIPAHLPTDHRPNSLTSHTNEYATYDQATISADQTTNPNSSTLVALLQQKVKTIPPNPCFAPVNGSPTANSISSADQIDHSTRSTGGHQLTNQTTLSNQSLRPVSNQSNSLMLSQSPYSSLRLSASAPAGSLQQAASAFLSTAHHKLVTPPSSPNLAELLSAKQTNGLANGHSLSPMTSMICQPRQTTLMPPSYAASYSQINAVVVNIPPSNPLQTTSLRNSTNVETGDPSCKAVAKPSKRSKGASKNRFTGKVLKPKAQRVKKPNNVIKQLKAQNQLSSFAADESRMNSCSTNVALVFSSPAANSDAMVKYLDQNNNSVQSNIENNFLLNDVEPKQPTGFADNSDALSNNSSSLGSNSLETSSPPKPNQSTASVDTSTKSKTTNNRKKVTQHFCSYSNCKKVYSKSSHLKGRTNVVDIKLMYINNN